MKYKKGLNRGQQAHKFKEFAGHASIEFTGGASMMANKKKPPDLWVFFLEGGRGGGVWEVSLSRFLRAKATEEKLEAARLRRFRDSSASSFRRFVGCVRFSEGM